MHHDQPIEPRTLRYVLLFGALLPGSVGLVASFLVGDLLVFGITVGVLVVFGATERWIARRPDDTVVVVTLVSLLVILALIPLYGGLTGPLMVALLSPVLLSGSSRKRWFGRLVLGVVVATVLAAYGFHVLGFEPLDQDAAEVWVAVLLSIIVTAALFSSRTICRHRDMADHACRQEQLARDALAERSTELGRRVQVEEELQQALRRAESASQAKSAFLANMSHELRTPLNAIIGYAEMLQEEEEATPEQAHDLSRIERSGRHLLTLINDILDLSKIEAGRMELHPVEVHLDRLVSEVAEEVRPMMDVNGNTFCVHDGASSRRLIADAVRVRQVLLNLLSNAAKFTDGGQVDLTITDERRGGREVLVFAVRDSGVGIAPVDMGRLFRPFVQAGAASGGPGGTGLGLVLSRRFAQMMDGEVEGRSELGVGSTFSFVLPLRAASAAVDAWTGRRVVEAKATGRPVALCVAEVAHDLELLDRRLEQEGLLMVPCRDGDRALELARKIDPAVVVVDLDAGGLDVFGRLRSDDAFDAIPVLLCCSGKESLPGLPLVSRVTKPVRQRGLQAALQALGVLTEATAELHQRAG